MPMPPATAPAIDAPQDVASLFALLDEIARGLAREAALAPDERTARADQILVWFAPRYAAIKAAAGAAPCPVRWIVHVADPAADPSDPDPHPCADCFAQRYRAWKASRGGLGGTSPG
jgi:hypothetical protein